MNKKEHKPKDLRSIDFVGALLSAMGIIFPVLNTIMMSSLPQERLSLGSGIFTMTGCLGNSVGIIVNAILLVLFGRHYLLNDADISVLDLKDVQQDSVVNIISSTHYDDQVIEQFG